MADFRVVPIGCHQVLDEIIGADGNEVDQIEHRIDGNGSGRDFQHHPDRDIGIVFPAPIEIATGLGDHRPHFFEFLNGGDHGEHHAHLSPQFFGMVSGAKDRTHLRPEKLRVFERKSNAPPAHEGIGFHMSMPQVWHCFVTTDIERADGHIVARTGIHDLSVNRQLFLFVGNTGVGQIQVFGSIEPHA